MDTKKKIVMIVAAVIIVIGIIVVAVKGFNVSLYLKDHTTFQFVFDQTFDKSDIKEICDEVFGDKKYIIRTVEVFDDNVYIISETITEEEQEELLEKLSNLYVDESETSEEAVTDETTEEAITETDEVATEGEGEDAVAETSEEEATEATEIEEEENYAVYYDSNVKLLDLLSPYVWPTVLSAIIIIIGMFIRYKILKSDKTILRTTETLAQSIVLLLVIISIIAILRIPVNVWVLPALVFFILLYIIIKFEIEIKSSSKEEKN